MVPSGLLGRNGSSGSFNCRRCWVEGAGKRFSRLALLYLSVLVLYVLEAASLIFIDFNESIQAAHLLGDDESSELDSTS